MRSKISLWIVYGVLFTSMPEQSTVERKSRRKMGEGEKWWEEMRDFNCQSEK